MQYFQILSKCWIDKFYFLTDWSKHNYFNTNISFLTEWTDKAIFSDQYVLWQKTMFLYQCNAGWLMKNNNKYK